MPRTRSAADNVDGDEQTAVASAKAREVKSDAAYHRRFVMCKENGLSGGIYQLRHPRTDSKALYQISVDAQTVNEVLVIDDKQRSFFYGDTVVSDGSITLLSPVHPLFLALPYLLKKATKSYVDLYTGLQDEEYPAAVLLEKNETLLRSLKETMKIDTYENLSDEKVSVYRVDEGLLMQWLEKRFEALKKALVSDAMLHKSISGDDVVLRRYTFGILADYLPEEIGQKLKVVLDIRDPSVQELVPESTNKRKAVISAEIDLDVPLAKKPPAMTAAQKKAQEKLKHASRGTKPLTSFFAKNG